MLDMSVSTGEMCHLSMLDASACKDSWDTIKNVSVDLITHTASVFTSAGTHQHAGGGASPDGGGQMSTSTLA